MGERENAIVETKLNILIEDFQRFRKEQGEVNKNMATHSEEENGVQAKILTTLRWHTVIGTFMMSIIVYLVVQGYGA